MSYILDALRRSDQDRKKGDVPDVQSQPDVLVRQSSVPVEAHRKNVLLWVLPILVALLLVWILPTSTNTDDGEPTTVKNKASLDGLQAADVAPMVPGEATQQEQLSSDDLHLDELKDVQLDISPVDDAEVPVPRAPISEPPEKQSTDALEAMTQQREVVAEPARTSTQPLPRGSDSIPLVDSPSSGADPYDGIPHQRQLPYDLQNALPELNVSVHLYSATPSSRLVRINSTIYREGDYIDSELRLEEITRDGLIMSIRNERFWQNAR